MSLRPASSARWACSILAFACIGGRAHAQWTPPFWTIQRAGLFDAEHTRNDGDQYSSLLRLNPNGRMIGQSTRFNGGFAAGDSAWTWTAADGTIRLGFLDGSHAASNGYRMSNCHSMNASGQVIGSSLRFDDPGDTGYSAWSWTSADGLVRIGFTDAEHTSANGNQSSLPRGVGAGGMVIGTSRRYGPLESGQSAWAWTAAGGTVPLGLTDAEHTGDGPYRVSEPWAVNAAGQVIGSTYRWQGLVHAGDTAWIWSDAAGAVRHGLTDAEHTSLDGRKSSFPRLLNNAGRVGGISQRYAGNDISGTSAWTWSAPDGTLRLGLTDAEHTKADGQQISSLVALNDAGRIIGQSQRYQGASNNGQTAWTWTAADGLIRLGLTDAEHTRFTGLRVSHPSAMNLAGRIIGSSGSFYPMGGSGQSAWTWTQATGTVRLGLIDSQHTAASEWRYTVPVALNAAGQVIGFSYRLIVDDDAGQSGWFFDPATDATTPLVFSASSMGAALTNPTILTESGWVLGNYDLYVGDTVASQNAFVWSLARGFSDLGALVDGGLSVHGWSALSEVLGAAEFQTIAGYGNLTANTGRGVFAITIPAPSAAALLPIALAAAMGRRRSRWPLE